MNRKAYNTNRPRVQCSKCMQLYTKANILRHEASCTGVVKPQYMPKYVDGIDLTCSYCGKLAKNPNSLAQHEVRCQNNPDRKDWDKLGKYSTQNRKGETQFTNSNIALVTQKLRDSYASGKLDRNRLPRNVVSIYDDHNQLEIEKWLRFTQTLTIELPEYSKGTWSGYVTVAKLPKELTDKYGSLIFEQQLVIAVALDLNNVCDFVVHHVNRIRDDNSIVNLMLFKNKRQHLQYHQSKYAYVTYDENTHVFDVEIRKPIKL